MTRRFIARTLTRFVLEDHGQDLIEYGLLGAFIAFVGILAWEGVRSGIGTKYAGWDGGVQGLSACTPDPGGGGC